MDPNKLKDQVKIAEKSVKSLDEPLKSKAFEIILNKLLAEESVAATSGDILNMPIEKKMSQPTNYDEDAADRLVNVINSTKYPLMFKLHKVLDRSLYLLYIVRKDHAVDGLNPSQIAKILSMKFRISTSQNAISMALMKAGNFVDRKQINTKGGAAYQYSIMYPGEEYIKQILQNPPDEIFKIKHRKSKPKKTTNKSKIRKSGLKDRIMKLKEEGYFDKPKERREVHEELELRGHHYHPDVIGTSLLRLVKKSNLRRIKEAKNNKSIYKYCNY